MALSGDRFHEAFKRAEFTSIAGWQPSLGGPIQTTDVILNLPQEELLGGEVHSNQYSISYPVTVFVGLKIGEIVTVAGVRYRVRENPLALGTGGFSTARLTRI